MIDESPCARPLRFMVPFVDMLNHDQQHGCQFSYEDDSDCFIVEWLGEVDPPRPGEQIYLDYGDKDGNELLLMYGFVPTQPTEHDYWLLDGAYCKVRRRQRHPLHYLQPQRASRSWM